MQRAFVTGAAGFIGSSSCDRLLQQWVQVAMLYSYMRMFIEPEII